MCIWEAELLCDEASDAVSDKEEGTQSSKFKVQNSKPLELPKRKKYDK